MGQRLAGIDAGGSATKVVLLEHGTVTQLPAAPPMNALLTEGIPDLLTTIINDSGADAAGVGMPGMRSPERAGRLARVLAERTGRPIVVTSDGDIARAGAHGGAPGIVVIAGTGSAAVGWDGVRRVQAGGHGFVLGDEGSAYWIGRAAARAALRWRDGLGGSAAVCRAVTETAGCTLDELLTRIYAQVSRRDLLAILAPPVTALAGTDPVARRICERAADHLAALAFAVRRRLRGTHIPVAGAGGVFRAPVIWARFAAKTGAIRPQASPAVGAALLAGAL